MDRNLFIFHLDARRWLLISFGLYAITACGLYFFTVFVSAAHDWNGKLTASLIVILTSYLASIACILPPGVGYFRSSRRLIVEEVYVVIMVLLAILCGILVSSVLITALHMSIGMPLYGGNHL